MRLSVSELLSIQAEVDRTSKDLDWLDPILEAHTIDAHVARLYALSAMIKLSIDAIEKSPSKGLRLLKGGQYGS